MTMKKYIIFTDGGARGNPGPAGIGAVLLDENNGVLKEISEYIGHTTNNQAEYQALCAALHAAHDDGATDVVCYLDSELVVKQMQGKYKVRDAGLQIQFVKAWNIASTFRHISFHHIPREKNKHADKLVNQAIDAEVAFKK